MRVSVGYRLDYRRGQICRMGHGTDGGARTHTAEVKVPCAAITLRRCICSTRIAPEPVARSGFYELPDIIRRRNPLWNPTSAAESPRRLKLEPRVVYLFVTTVPAPCTVTQPCLRRASASFIWMSSGVIDSAMALLASASA